MGYLSLELAELLRTPFGIIGLDEAQRNPAPSEKAEVNN